jgi:hypothetical protein
VVHGPIPWIRWGWPERPITAWAYGAKADGGQGQQLAVMDSYS